jgi:hypothetical protein
LGLWGDDTPPGDFEQRLSSQFAGFSILQFGTIRFTDNSAIDLTTHQIETVGTTGNDTISGIIRISGNFWIGVCLRFQAI